MPLEYDPKKMEALRGTHERSEVGHQLGLQGASVSRRGIWGWENGSEPKALHLLLVARIFGDRVQRAAAGIILDAFFSEAPE